MKNYRRLFVIYLLPLPGNHNKFRNTSLSYGGTMAAYSMMYTAFVVIKLILFIPSLLSWCFICHHGIYLTCLSVHLMLLDNDNIGIMKHFVTSLFINFFLSVIMLYRWHGTIQSVHWRACCFGEHELCKLPYPLTLLQAFYTRICHWKIPQSSSHQDHLGLG